MTRPPVRALLAVPLFAIVTASSFAADAVREAAEPSRPAETGVGAIAPDALAEEPPTGAADRPGEDRPYWRRNLFRRVFSDQKYLVTTWWPQELKRPEFSGPIVAGLLAGGAAGHADGMPGDAALGANIDHRSTRGGGDRVAGDFTHLGNGTTIAFLLGTTYLFSRIGDHDRLSETSSLSAEALLDAGIWIELLKRTFARVRPNEPGAGQFFEYGAADNSSFPSGHAMGAFTVATVFAHQYADKRWMPWVAYGTAGLIATSRVALGRHFPTDVLVGGFLGNSIGRMVVGRNRESEDKPSFVSHLSPMYDPTHDGYGVMYSRSW